MGHGTVSTCVIAALDTTTETQQRYNLTTPDQHRPIKMEDEATVNAITVHHQTHLTQRPIRTRHVIQKVRQAACSRPIRSRANDNGPIKTQIGASKTNK